MDSRLWESRELAELVGIDERKARYWATSKVLVPAVDTTGRSGVRRKYDFHNLIEAAILRELDRLKVTISVGKEALRLARQHDFGSTGFCCLVVGSDETVHAVTDETYRANAEYRRTEELIEDPFDSMNALLKTQVRLRDPMFFREQAFFAAFTRELLGTKRSSLIIPVHYLYWEISQKVGE